MNRRKFIQTTALVSAVGHAFGEAQSPAPIPEPHFPSRLHLFVWRNWELANTDRMAAVVHARPDQILDVGRSLGLPPKPILTQDQLNRIYITVIRQNWHVLPDTQIIELLGWTSERFAFTLKEDDFLDVKLGKVKPKCELLAYHPPTLEEQKKAEWVRTTVQRNFGTELVGPCEGPVQFVQELSTFRYAPNRNKDARAVTQEVDLSSGWSIAGNGGVLRAAAERFSRYMSGAMDAPLPAAAAGSRQIELVSGDQSISADDGFRIEADHSRVRIAAHNDAGVLQGLYWLQDRMEQREGPFIPAGTTIRRFAWNPRFLYSYFALYGDPLMEPAADPFPDAYLERLARTGINGVWIQGVLNTLAPSKIFPEFGAGSEIRLKNLNALVNRAARFGVKVYVYLNEPRAMPPAFFRNHPDVKGAFYGGLNAMCTSVASVREWIASSLGHVCERAPELGGIFCITMSENLTNCFSKWDVWGIEDSSAWAGGDWGSSTVSGAPRAGGCPRCSKRRSWDVIGELIQTFRDGIRRSSKKADVMAWDWGWGDELARNLIPLLPKDVRFLSVSEWDHPVHRGGVNTKVAEYSISVVGPGPRAQRNWDLARANGLQPLAKVQFNNTWEISAVPYIPVMQLILRHCENLTHAKITGILASWTCGGYASPNLSAAKAYYFDSPAQLEDVALSAARQRYGEAAAPIMVEAWQQFSTAFEQFPYGVAIYVIPTQHGPANLLRLRPTGYRAGMILFPYDDYRAWAGVYPPPVVQSQFAKMAALWSGGLETFQRGMKQVPAHKLDSARQDLAIALTCYCHFQSVANQVEFYLLRDGQGGVEPARTRARMREIAHQEIQLARKQFPVARQHSVIAYEASNHYYYRPLDLVEKVLNCQQILDSLDERTAG